jgi:arylsulfatase A-like enzyme
VGYFGDWLATAAELAGAPAPANVDSLSFAPTLFGQAAQKRHEFLYWEFHEGGFQQAALYQGRWKGLRSGSPDAPVVLYNLQSDIAEQTDIAAQHPAVTKEISAYLQSARSSLPDWEPQWRKPPRR